MASALSIVSIIAFVLAGLFLAVAVALWFIFGVPGVIGDLTGRNARRSVQQLRSANERTGGKSYRPSKTNLERGMLTSTMAHSRTNIQTANSSQTHQSVESSAASGTFSETGMMDENKAMMYAGDETTSLGESDSMATMALDQGGETMSLGNWQSDMDDSEMETSTLSPNGVAEMSGPKKTITMVEETVFIHTDSEIRTRN